MSFAQSYTALEGGLVDVALFIEPFYSRSNEMSQSKYGKPLKVIYTYLTDFPQGLDLSGMIANTNFAAGNPDTVRAFSAHHPRGKMGQCASGRAEEDHRQICRRALRRHQER